MVESRVVSLFNDTIDAYNDGAASNADRILDLAEAAWATYGTMDLSARELGEIGEIARRAAIVCTTTHRNGKDLWRSRSLTLFTLANCPNGIAMLVLMSALASFGEGDADGALNQLALMAALKTSGDGPISGERVESTMLENTAIVQMHLEEWDAARRSLTAVVELEGELGDFRRIQKARASLITIDYCTGEKEQAIRDLAALVETCESHGGAGSIVEIGNENLGLMRAGELNLSPYQVI